MSKYIHIIIVIFIIILVLSNINKRENFDQRVDGCEKVDCGIMCTKILGCKGWAYDSENKQCYLSKDDIIFRPTKKAYTAYYNRNFPRCNKLYKIDDPYYNSRNNILRNATYQCREKEGGSSEFKIYDNKERSGINPEKINKYKVDPYTFERIDWVSAIPSSTGYYNSAIELIVPRPEIKPDKPQSIDRFLFNGTSENIIPSLDEINDNTFSGTRPIYDPINDTTPGIQITDSGTINLDKNLHLITNPTKAESINIMNEYDEEFIGQYLFPHKCSTNISKEDCMKQCLNNDDCVGTEWNPILFIKKGEPNLYEFEENVCCPKTRIKKVIKRRKPNRKGHFYLKEKKNRQTIQNGQIMVGLNKDKKEYVFDDLENRYSNWKNNVY